MHPTLEVRVPASHSRGESALILKLDYEKAYNRVDWSFLDDMLLSRGFGPVFRGWIKSLLVGA
jgi:hypothetical protein